MLPIVIDSPKQQDLDTNGKDKFISLCTDDLSKNNQVIIGAVSLESNMHGYHQIELKEKYSLLNSEKYEIAFNNIMPFYEKACVINYKKIHVVNSYGKIIQRKSRAARYSCIRC